MSTAPSTQNGVFWSGVVIGGAVIVFGLRGLFDNLRLTRIANLALFFGASGIAHDALWAPLLVLGGVATRGLGPMVRRPVRVGLALSVGVTLFALPVLHPYSGRDANPSALPLDYRHNLGFVLMVIWLIVGAHIARQRRRVAVAQ